MKLKATLVREGSTIFFFREGEKPLERRSVYSRWSGNIKKWLRPTRGRPRQSDYSFCLQGLTLFGLGALSQLPKHQPVEVSITLEVL